MPKESEIAGLYYCAFLAFHHLIKLNATDDMSVPQGENLSGELLMAWLGQGRFQVTDPHGKAAFVSHPRKLCILLVWKSSTLTTARSAQNSTNIYPCRYNTLWWGFTWWCCLTLSTMLHGHTAAALWVPSSGEERSWNTLLPYGWWARTFAVPSKALMAAQGLVAWWGCLSTSPTNANICIDVVKINLCGCPEMLGRS